MQIIKNHFKKYFYLLLFLLGVLLFFNGLMPHNKKARFKNNIVNPQKGPRIFCFMLTKPDNFFTKTTAVYKTWVRKCDYHRFISIIPESFHHYDEYKSRIRNVDGTLELNLLDDLIVLQPEGMVVDKYSKLTDKVYYAMRHIYRQYKDEFDWFLKADDDTYMIMDNLREFLASKNASDPVTFGYNFKVIVKNGYHSGGAGYLLSKEAFNRVGKVLNKNTSLCHNTGVEDVDLAKCLRLLKVNMGKSIDHKGLERFHPLGLDAYFYDSIPDWMYDFSETRPQKMYNCCSESTISFHYVARNEMYILERLEKEFDLKDPVNRKATFDKFIDKFIEIRKYEENIVKIASEKGENKNDEMIEKELKKQVKEGLLD